MVPGFVFIKKTLQLIVYSGTVGAVLQDYFQTGHRRADIEYKY